jgi:hypothetical protein
MARMGTHTDDRAQDVFKRWLDAEIAPFMKERGFRRSGTSFTHRNPDATAVVAFQKHPDSTADQVLFWVNAGVWSPRLATVLDALTGVRQPRPPSVHGCQWSLTFDDLMIDAGQIGDALYWAVNRDTSERDLARLGESVRERLDSRAIPAVLAVASEPALRDALIAGPVMWGQDITDALVAELTRAGSKAPVSP